MRASHPTLRLCLLAVGVLLVLITPLVALLPGPGGVFSFGGGMMLILRNSRWARRRFARFKRGWPRTGGLADRLLRRPSAKRRRERVHADLN